MNITVIYGQNHKGSTYRIARMLAEKLGREIQEIFLPRDFDCFCTGCTTCFMLDETRCPHAARLAQKKGWNETDAAYWRKQGWTAAKRPWKE